MTVTNVEENPELLYEPQIRKRVLSSDADLIQIPRSRFQNFALSRPVSDLMQALLFKNLENLLQVTRSKWTRLLDMKEHCPHQPHHLFQNKICSLNYPVKVERKSVRLGGCHLNGALKVIFELPRGIGPIYSNLTIFSSSANLVSSEPIPFSFFRPSSYSLKGLGGLCYGLGSRPDIFDPVTLIFSDLKHRPPEVVFKHTRSTRPTLNESEEDHYP